jgi:hypothetical protein
MDNFAVQKDLLAPFGRAGLLFKLGNFVGRQDRIVRGSESRKGDNRKEANGGQSPPMAKGIGPTTA